AFSDVFPQDRYPFPDDDVRAAWTRVLADPEVEVYLAEVDGEPAASVSVGHGFLRTLYVLPAHQRTGIGSALHDHALERLRARGAQQRHALLRRAQVAQRARKLDHGTSPPETVEPAFQRQPVERHGLVRPAGRVERRRALERRLRTLRRQLGGELVHAREKR